MERTTNEFLVSTKELKAKWLNKSSIVAEQEVPDLSNATRAESEKSETNEKEFYATAGELKVKSLNKNLIMVEQEPSLTDTTVAKSRGEIKQIQVENYLNQLLIK